MRCAPQGVALQSCRALLIDRESRTPPPLQDFHRQNLGCSRLEIPGPKKQSALNHYDALRQCYNSQKPYRARLISRKAEAS